MKKIIASLLLALFSVNAFATGYLTGGDFKTLSQITGAGGSYLNLLGTDKIGDLTNGQTLKASIDAGILGGSGGGGGGGINLLQSYNYNFEKGTTSWTSSSGDTYTTVTSGSGLLFDTKSAAYTASASGKTLVSTSVAVPNGLANGNCYAEIYYKYAGTAGDYSLQVDDGSGNLLASAIQLPQATSSQLVTLNYPCGTGNNRLQIKSNVASPSTIYIDNAYVGSPKNIGSVAQAYLVGTLSVSGCSSSWTTSGTSLAAFSTQSGCVYTATGALLAPTTNIPGFKVSSLAPGDYAVEYEGKVMALSGAGTSATAYYRFSDGTNLSREISSAEGDSGSSAINSGSPGIKQTISYTTAQSNITLQVQGYANSGGTAAIYGTSGQPGVFRLWYFPSSSQQAVRADAVPASWSGYQTVASGWNTSSSTFADPSAGTTIALTQTTNRNFGTVTSAASSLPGIAMNLPKLGMYEVCAAVTVEATSGGTSGSVRLVDGSGTIINPGQSIYFDAAASARNITACGQYNATSLATTFKVQLATNASNVNIYQLSSISGTAAIQWTVKALDSPMPAPYLVGSLTSSSSGVTRIESAIIHNNGSTCSATSQAGGNWISGGSRPQGGQCQVNFNAGIFSAAPICQVTANTSIGWVPGYPSRQCTPNTNASTSGMLVDCYYSSSGAASTYTDLDFNLTCQGAH